MDRPLIEMTVGQLADYEVEKLATQKLLEKMLDEGIEWYEIDGWRLSTQSELTAVNILLDMITVQIEELSDQAEAEVDYAESNSEREGKV